MNPTTDFAIVILAAGNSSRMGTSKQLLEVNGRTLLLHTVNSAIASQIPNIVVVLGANAEAHHVILKEKSATVIVNNDWIKGMGSSLKLGVKKAIEQYTDVQAIMVMVCDQPLISSIHINNLVKAYQQHGAIAVASHYNDTFGVPALFDRSVFSSLMKIGDEMGARQILKKLEQDLIPVPFIGGEIDLDTPEDYQKFIDGKS